MCLLLPQPFVSGSSDKNQVVRAVIDLLCFPERLDESAMAVLRKVVKIPSLGQLAAYPLEEAEGSALGDAVHRVDLAKTERLDAIEINRFDRLHGRPPDCLVSTPPGLPITHIGTPMDDRFFGSREVSSSGPCS